MSKKCKQIILKVRICVGQYPTQLTVTLQNCRKIWSSIFVTFLVFFALFFANSFTVMVALVAKPLVLPSQWTLLQKIVQKTLEMWLKLLQTFLQFSNVTVSCVKYHFPTWLDYYVRVYCLVQKWNIIGSYLRIYMAGTMYILGARKWWKNITYGCVSKAPPRLC